MHLRKLLTFFGRSVSNTSEQLRRTCSRQVFSEKVPTDSQTIFERLSPPPLPPNDSILLQPETRPITQEQLVNEVKGIYAGLVMVEKKCVEVLSFTISHLLHHLLIPFRRWISSNLQLQIDYLISSDKQ